MELQVASNPTLPAQASPQVVARLVHYLERDVWPDMHTISVWRASSEDHNVLRAAMEQRKMRMVSLPAAYAGDDVGQEWSWQARQGLYNLGFSDEEEED